MEGFPHGGQAKSRICISHEIGELQGSALCPTQGRKVRSEELRMES